MRISDFFITTTREIPADADLVSHQLMLRAGLIHQLSSGLYTWMPLGLRALRKVENIIREEMDQSGAIELLMPSIQPADLWKKSERWQAYGAELLRIKDRHQRDFIFGPTHEEVITDFVRQQIKSYKQLPVNYYQIQTKFRDEIRPRFGIMRAREFLMKDAYSFHLDTESLDKTYQKMYQTYGKIFKRLGLNFLSVLADTGNIGGKESHEFHVLSDNGEDAIAFSDSSDYAANVEMVPTQVNKERPTPTESLERIETPGVTTIQGLSDCLSVSAEQCLKAIFVKGADGGIVALFVCGHHMINAVKAQKHLLIASPLELANDEEIKEVVGCNPGYLGPVKLNLPVVVDYAAANMSDFICGANQDGVHYQGVNWGRDTVEPELADLRNIEIGDPSPDGVGLINIKRGIEVGHIFKLGTQYSTVLNAEVLNQEGNKQIVTMGCYGIGVSRIVAAAIEQNHDDDGIIWSLPMAPFQVIITPIQYHRSQKVKQLADNLLAQLEALGIETLLDDRNLRAGEMFADADLIGIPYRLVVSERNLENQALEYHTRKTKQTKLISIDTCITMINDEIHHELHDHLQSC